MTRSSALVLACVITALAAVGAEQPDQAAKPAAPSLSDQFPGLEFRNIGPFRGGRVTAVAGVPESRWSTTSAPRAAASGRRPTAAPRWEPLSDKFLKTGSVGRDRGRRVRPERDLRRAWARRRSAATPRTATASTSRPTRAPPGRTSACRTRSRSRASASTRRTPTSSTSRRRATCGGRTPTAASIRTVDGGKTWKKVLFVDDKTGASDLAMDPTNPRILYAAFWQVYRKPWTLESGGPGGGLWKSTDGGDTWKKLTGGLPEGVVGKVTVAVSRVAARRASGRWSSAEKGGLYRSDDGGEKWTLVNGAHRHPPARPGTTRTSSPTRATPTPSTSRTSTFLKSIDGGKTFSRIRVRHGDTHDLWIDPDDPQRMIEGDDGGAEITFNGGQTLVDRGQPADGAVLPRHHRRSLPLLGLRRAAGQHDGRHPERRPRRRHQPRRDWHDVGGGESAGSPPTRATPTSSTPAATAARSRATTTRRARRARSSPGRRSSTARPART